MEKTSTGKPPLAIITGAAQRLGKVFAQTLAKRGYAIGLHYYQSEKKAQQFADELISQGNPVVFLRADLRRQEQMDRLLREVDSSGFIPQVLVNSAAEMIHKPITEITIQEWDEQFALNLRATWYMSTHLAERMPDGGVIINISDVGAQKAWSSFGAYSITKAGINSLTQLLARSLAPRIRVCAIAPGLVLPPEVLPGEEWEKLLSKTPQKAPVSLNAISSALEFLLDNNYVTGDILAVDGGRQLV